MENKTELFISKAKLVHGDKYDYSLVNYVNNYTKVKIICPKHGEFNQIPKDHIRGCGCKFCGFNTISKKILSNTSNFIEKAKVIHLDKYDYSNTDYINNKTNLSIICSIHGVFKQTPSDHLQGKGCPSCSGRNKTNEQYINQANLIHDNKYDYSLINYINSHKKITLICPLHGVFEQKAYSHLNGRGCPVCDESKGEREIRMFLTTNNLKYIKQHRFYDCKDVRALPFDFYLPELNICIEFQGKQHYEPITYFGGLTTFNGQQKRDKIKMEYCFTNNIKLITIKYNDNINEIFNLYF